MLRIGYVSRSHPNHAEAAERLRSLGCHVVRVEDGVDAMNGRPVLASIVEFVGDGDELLAFSLEHVAHSPRELLDLVEQLDRRGARLTATEPPITTAGVDGETFRAVLRALAPLHPIEPHRRRRAAKQEIYALRRAGVGPAEIARRLGVSRMTVWRKLRGAEA